MSNSHQVATVASLDQPMTVAVWLNGDDDRGTKAHAIALTLSDEGLADHGRGRRDELGLNRFGVHGYLQREWRRAAPIG